MKRVLSLIWISNLLITILILSVFLCGTQAPALSAVKISHDGYITTGMGYEYHEMYGETYYTGKMEFNMEVSKFISGQMDIRAKSEDREIELREVHMQFDYTSLFSIRIGNIKNRFGLEELVKEEDLPTIDESLLNRHLIELGFAGRNPGIQIFRKFKGKEGPSSSFYATLSYNESHNAFITGRYGRHYKGFISHGAVSGVFMRYSSAEPIYVYALGADAGFRLGKAAADIEVFGGKDPLDTAARKVFGSGESVYFTGIKVSAKRHYDINTLVIKSLEPVLLTGILFPDTDCMKYNKIQMLCGINVYFDENVRLRFNGDILASNNRYNTRDRTLIGSMVTAELQMRW